MAESPEVPETKGPSKKGLGKGLTKKVGPLPLWAWYAGAGVILGGVILYFRRGSDGGVVAPSPTGGITEGSYGSGGFDGAGGGGIGDFLTPVPEVPQVDQQPDPPPNVIDYQQEPYEQPIINIYSGGMDETPKAATSNAKKKTSTAARVGLSTSSKSGGSVKVNNQAGNPRKGQSYTVTKRADGSSVHTYKNGKKVVVAPPKKSTVTVSKAVATKVNTTGNARSGQTYTVHNRSDGRKEHRYKDGTKVVVGKATKAPAKKAPAKKKKK